MGYDGCGPMSSWHSRRTRLAALLLIASYSAFSQSARLGNSCDLAAVGAKDTQGFLMFDQELRAAISTQDAVPMALLVRYPLRINEGDHGSYSLNNPAALQSHFAEVFPPAVRAAVLKQKPETVFCTSTGVTYGDGALWIGTTGGRYVIEVINLPGVRGASRPRNGAQDRVRLRCGEAPDRDRCRSQRGATLPSMEQAAPPDGDTRPGDPGGDRRFRGYGRL